MTASALTFVVIRGEMPFRLNTCVRQTEPLVKP